MKFEILVFKLCPNSDPTVDRMQARNLASALRRKKKPVELQILPHDGHRVLREDSRLALYGRLERFFDAALGAALELPVVVSHAKSASMLLASQ